MSQVILPSSTARPAVYAVLAEFAGVDELRAAARRVRDAEYKRFDVFTPYPVHGMDQAMGLARSGLGWIVLAAGACGVGAALLLQWYANVVDYPLITQGKPYFSWQAFVPVIFEMMVLFAAFGAVIGMFLLNGLPAWYHPTLKHDLFSKVTNDGFFLAIEAGDALFDPQKTAAFLEAIGGRNVALLEE